MPSTVKIMIVAAFSSVLVSCSAHRSSVFEAPEVHFLSQTCEDVSIPEAAFSALLETETFRDTHVGYAGVVPTEVCAFLTVLAQPDAVSRFERLLEDGHLASQLYALCGLYLMSRNAFEAALLRFTRGEEEIQTQFGCVLMSSPVDELVDRIRSGELPSRFDQLSKDSV